MLRTSNAAKMINEMSTHASMYIPLSVPPTQPPRYVHIDRDSQWHTSALLSAALESMTLPTRLRHDTQKRGSVDDLGAALNVNGNQRIAQLQCSILNHESLPFETATTHGSADDRAPSGNSHVLVEEDGLKHAEPRLDMNFSCYNTRSTSPFAIQQHVSHRVFGAVETTRAKIEAAKDEATGEDEFTYARKRRRFAGLPVIERFVTLTFSWSLPLRKIFPYPFSSGAGTTPRLNIHSSIASRQFSGPRRVPPKSRSTPHFLPRQGSLSE